MKKYYCLLFLFLSFLSYSQANDILTLNEYLGFVKKYHPIVKQAKLQTTESEIKLLKARGAFDPKIEVDLNKKEFKDKEYFNKLNTAFKIPTWYGIELKANYEKNSGIFLNPEANVPDDGLYGVGISMSLARGFLTNNRMATLKKSKNYLDLAKAKQQLLTSEILYDALIVYFNWLKNYRVKKTYEDFFKNAESRLDIVKKSFNEGDKAGIDTLEASINYNSRKLDLEKSKIKYLKSKLALSNYLWLENNIPLELKETIIPNISTLSNINYTLNLPKDTITTNLSQHSKIRSLAIKKENLTIDKKLKLNNLLPKVDINYNFLSSYIEQIPDFKTKDYKAGLYVYIPLFMRKERADYKLSKLKLQDIDFSITANRIKLSNKVKGIFNEIESYEKQFQILQNLVVDYKKMVFAEERKFILGEGSLFLINYREVKLIETRLKLLNTENSLLKSKASLYNFSTNILP